MDDGEIEMPEKKHVNDKDVVTLGMLQCCSIVVTYRDETEKEVVFASVRNWNIPHDDVHVLESNAEHTNFAARIKKTIRMTGENENEHRELHAEAVRIGRFVELPPNALTLKIGAGPEGYDENLS
jgi:hypothetical protein